ncbi:MAG: type II secretion system protein [Elusimicrobia bacterium]|nr:type II secretion system protein [Elusimicrobiota bacterium]
MRMMRASRGYTLTELMMVVGIVGIVASTGPTLMTKLEDFYLMSTARSEIQRDARASLDTINRYLRQAVNGTIVIDADSSQGPYSRIRFKHVDGRYMEFRQSGNQLIQVIDSNSSVISKNLTYIAFSFPRTDDPTIISVSLTMSKAIQLSRTKVLELTIEKVRVMN